MRKVMSAVIISFFLFSFSIFSMGAVFAQNGVSLGMQNIQQEEVNPIDGFRYGLKRLNEKFNLLLFTISPSRKAEYYRELLVRRLSELKYVIEEGDLANFERSTTRYSTTAGMLTEYILSKNLEGERQKAVKLMSSHLPVVDELSQFYEYDTAEWRFVRQDVDYLGIYISQLQSTN